jgi:hypothetical protein
VLLLATSLVASGCTVPGSARIQGPPSALPEAIRFLPADALGWTLIDPDPDAPKWAPLERPSGIDISAAAYTQQWAPFFGDGLDYAAVVAPWVGDRAGTALLSVRLDERDARMGFADVDDRGKLESVLRDAGWKRSDADLGEGVADDLELWRAGADADTTFTAIGIADDAMVGAVDDTALRDILRQTERNAAIRQKDTNDFSVDALRTPLAVVFSADIVRDQLRHFVATDRGQLEFYRWFNEMGSVAAWRDGWLGLAPPIDSSRAALRLVGAAKWEGELATKGEPTPARLDSLESLGADVRVGIALDDPGLYAEDLIAAGPGDGSSFATEPEEGDDAVNLFELVDRYDGPAALGYYRTRVELRADAGSDSADLLADTKAALDFARVRRITADADADGEIVVRWGFEAEPAIVAPEHPRLGDTVELEPLFGRAGKPPRPPIAWLYARPTPDDLACEPVVGWVAWDGDQRMGYSFDLPVAGPDCSDNVARLLLPAGAGVPVV